MPIIVACHECSVGDVRADTPAAFRSHVLGSEARLGRASLRGVDSPSAGDAGIEFPIGSLDLGNRLGVVRV